MNETLNLPHLRASLARPWLIILFGVAYGISQITIIVILEPISDAMIRLQIGGFAASDYIAVFNAWDASGLMASYRAHFVLDDVHWIWYTGLFTALLCWLFERHRIADRHNWLLLLPLASGLLDWYENRLQHVFLGSADYSTIVDPLPLFSTVASDFKWLLSLAYIGLSVALLLRRRTSAQSA